MSVEGSVAGLFRYPVKSLQGLSEPTLELTAEGVVGDRRRALIDSETGRLMTAKRWGRLLEGIGGEHGVDLPDGTHVPYGAPDADALLSAWIGRPVRLAVADPATEVAYEMTFDPPDDESEYFAIPAAPGSFLDLAPIHLIARTTLEHGAASHPELDWDVRRFRPNLLLDVAVEPFGEDGWAGRRLRVGEAVLRVRQPTVRCAMPLRAQPAVHGGEALDRQPGLYRALDALHANHLGVYVDVVEGGRVSVGDRVEVADGPT